MHRPMNYVKSKQRVADHGEVFTPAWMVEAMLDLVKDETERIDSRFLEPACGSGNFLVRILQRKLAAVELKFGKSDFERRHYALLALMCTYGIELLEDNIAECRAKMLEIFAEYLIVDESAELYRAASLVLSQNLVHGNALTMRTHDGQPITFAEWGYLGKGRFQRRDFLYDTLTQSSAFSAKGSLFAHLAKHDIFTPRRAYPPVGGRAGRRDDANGAGNIAQGGGMNNRSSFHPRASLGSATRTLERRRPSGSLRQVAFVAQRRGPAHAQATGMFRAPHAHGLRLLLPAPTARAGVAGARLPYPARRGPR